jgi:hypothetical protein
VSYFTLHWFVQKMHGAQGVQKIMGYSDGRHIFRGWKPGTLLGR